MEFRILSYNIHRAIGVDRRFRPERIAAVLAHYDADIVLLQEVDVGVPRSRELNLARELAESCNYPYSAVGLNVQLRKGMYGNATLSRYPIVRERNIDLTLDGRKARGCLFTELELPVDASSPVLLPVFNLHLGLSFKERPQQVGRLVRTPEFTALAQGDRCVVAGDFNDWWTRIAPLFTEALGFACATNHGVGYQNAMLTYPSFSPSTGLDKVFCRGPITVLGGRRCRLRVSKVASDHLPVIVDLQL
ncbi:endonuclease/exonuclease/phosphatase family protein [Thiovibrio frasassiensis]|uniref:Endonuclease/exonuclease/phosphatase family protein n=1 Tax=Thiovibrio frasassiensis TaxID=2984131 RepID=A0A9X4RKX6_9BACT|nr:endonuclease/exonuclease/phosphatase family protein [Thiovibrio frasassiensis]MDG4475059.1 endonuclease/exonuclease/phosphatase family protein [Thiovibrio frasassiensis]